MKRGKVVLFYPAYDGPPLSAPVCLLSLAAVLRDADFDVCVIDAAVTRNEYDVLLSECRDALCVGISVLTGPMIRGAIRAAKNVKRTFPNIPIVFGGWHASLLPGQTLNEPYVDFIVRGQGELTFLELVEAFAGRSPATRIAGTSGKYLGLPGHAPERPVAPLDSLPMPAYELLNFDAYEAVCGERKLAYATSVGCPYACNYCTDMVFYKRRFNALSPSRVVEEMTTLAERNAIDEVALLDSNFPVDIRRAVVIAGGINASKVRFRWTFQASTRSLAS